MKARFRSVNEATFESVTQRIPAEILQVFALGLHLGCWPDGQQLTKEQREICTEVLAMLGHDANSSATPGKQLH